MTIIAPLQAVGDTIHGRMCPLYSFDRGEKIHMVGSSIPFTSGGISFLITATHVCVDGRGQFIPRFTWGTGGPRPLRNQRLMWEHRPGRPDFDIALLALSDEDRADLETCYNFSDPTVTANVKPKTPGIHYIIAGYPSARNRMRSCMEIPPARATYLVTDNILEVSALKLSEKTDSHHFALGIKAGEVRTLDSQPFRMPKPQGMSGGGIWRLDIDVRTKLATSPLLVGIGIEYHKSKEAFVASRIQLAIPLVHDLLSIISGSQPRDVIVLGNRNSDDG